MPDSTANHDAVRTPQPFLKWAGGKGQLLAQYEPYFPRAPLRSYYEPFVGSGAVFFRLREQDLFDHYHLSETNAELINCYRAVRDDLDDLLALLETHRAQHSRDYYYAVRNLDRQPGWEDTPETVRAARMIYLNKTCYNGLWRVNRSGHFNVPMGRYKKPNIVNEAGLRVASRALRGVHLSVQDFERVLYQARQDDFVYMDPPYFPLSETANFTSYQAEDFGIYEQKKLALVFEELHRRGVRVMLSNSDTPFVRELYAGFRIETMHARRTINSKSSQRGFVNEVIVLNY